jgi:uncharacterized surface protein with fasciclin (FAS1) repeats
VIGEALLPPWVDVSIYEQLNLDPDFSALVTLLHFSGLTSLLNNTEGPWTLLAPNNTAFTTSAGNKLNTSNNATFVREFLNRHIISGNLYAPIHAATSSGSVITTWNNQTLPVETVGNITFVGGAKLLATNWLASNGVIHVIDRVVD